VTTLRWILLAVIALGVGAPVLLYASARRSLDAARTHTAKTLALPLLGATDEGLVRIPARGLEFRARVAGLANDGPGVIFLHGFPETSVMWEPLLTAASEAGFRAVAFDQRGYSPGARFEDTEAYGIEELVADLFGVADAVGFERFHLVGHDWGSVVGWVATGSEPGRVLSWASLSIPHPRAVQEARGENGPPLYVRVFRTPGVGETLFLAGGMRVLRSMNPDLPPEHLEEYVAVFSEPGAMTAALDWYRAIEIPASFSLVGEVSQPVLYVFGNRDMPVFVGKDVRARQPRFVTGPSHSVELDAGHWLIQEKPDAIVSEVMEHLRAQPAP
jgi:pimeloyl-ACP methyl ester carboxylesterase